MEKFLSEYWISSSGLGIQHRSSSFHNVLLLETFLPFSPKKKSCQQREGNIKLKQASDKAWREMRESISSSSAHNICIDHSNIYFQCLAWREIPLTFCLQASHYLAFLLKTSPATKSVVSGLYQGVFQLEVQMEETRLSPILRQGFSHHSPGNNTATGTFLPFWTLPNLLQDTRKQQSHVLPARAIPAGQRKPHAFLLGCHHHNKCWNMMVCKGLKVKIACWSEN